MTANLLISVSSQETRYKKCLDQSQIHGSSPHPSSGRQMLLWRLNRAEIFDTISSATRKEYRKSHGYAFDMWLAHWIGVYLVDEVPLDSVMTSCFREIVGTMKRIPSISSNKSMILAVMRKSGSLK